MERSLYELAVVVPRNDEVQQQLAMVRRDHAPLVFAWDGARQLVGPEGRDERLVIEGYGAVWPVWSPDRGRIAFISTEGPSRVGGGKLFVVNGDGGALTELASDVRSDITPAWSPDGSRFAFLVDGRTLRIEVLNGGSRSIDVGSGGGRSLTWSPDGQAVVILGTWYGSASTLIPLTETGSDLEFTQITFDFDMDRRFSGSPSGRRFRPSSSSARSPTAEPPVT